MRAKCRRCPLSQSRRAECAVTRFYDWHVSGLHDNNGAGIGRELEIYTYVPDHNGSRCPFHTDLEVLRQGNVVIQKFQESV